MADYDSWKKCWSCGQGGSQIPTLGLSKFKAPGFRLQTEEATPNYCGGCGASLRSKCISCDGTGKKNRFTRLSSPLLPLTPRQNYCTECGRSLPSEDIDDTCFSCDGTGEIVDTNHICFGRRSW